MLSRVIRGHTVVPALVSVCLAAVALVALLLLHPGGEVAAEPRLTLPPNQPALGLIYNGLAVGGPATCPGTYLVVGTDLCSHGPDAAPGGLDLSVPVAALATIATAATPTFVCDGDGVSGNRLQVLYVRPQSTADRYAAALPTLRTAVAGVDTILNESAAETGGIRHLRLVTGTGCDLDVARVTLSDATTADFGKMVTELQAQGYGRGDRKYIIFMDTNTYCGLGTVFQNADQPGADNPNNFGPSYARVDSGCWVSYALAHEVMHMLGGVLASAPHGTANGHCTDAYDVLCYVDAPGVKLQTLCPGNATKDRFDCNHDDYFHTNPAAGSYLATHWNAANNQFLLQTGPAASVTPAASPSPSPTPSPAPSASSAPSPTANPAAPGPALTVNAAVGGTVAVSPAAPYQTGQAVTLTPMAAPGQLFLGWQIGGRATNAVGTAQLSSWVAPLTLTLTGDTTVTPIFAARPAFGDVAPRDPAAEAIAQLATLGVIRGYANGDFGATDHTQRAQMAALIVRAMGWGGDDWGNPFADRGQTGDDLWRNVGTLAHYGVTRGYDGVSFGPTDEISQVQVIAFITRAMVAKGYWTPVTVDTPGLYADITVASGFRYDVLTFHRYAGGIPGTTPNQGYAAAGTPATRAWFAQTLRQALDSVYNR